MSQWPPDRTSFLFMVALSIAVLWMIAAALGRHPDGSILGFAGTLLVVWSTTTREKKRRGRINRRRRQDDSDDQQDQDEDDSDDDEDDPYDWRTEEDDEYEGDTFS